MQTPPRKCNNGLQNAIFLSSPTAGTTVLDTCIKGSHVELPNHSKELCGSFMFNISLIKKENLS